jgi:dihydroceramidase
VNMEKEGFWGKATSTVNWCEADYAVTDYVCEFFNTISSLVISAFGMWGFAHCPPHTEPRVRLAYVALVVIGLGSAAFHGTLLYGPQLLDELPMLYGASIWLFVLVTAHKEFPKNQETLLQLGLTLYSLLATYLVIAFRYSLGAVVLPVAFGVLVAANALQMRRLFYRHELRETGLRHVAKASFFYFFLGTVVWVLERPTCAYTEALHFHSLWHILSGAGGYFLCTFGAGCRALKRGYPVRVHVSQSMLPLTSSRK